MSTVTYRPNAAGSYTNITATYPEGSTHYQMVDEVTTDEGATTLSEYGSVYKVDTFHFANPSQTGTINKITVYARMCNSYGAETVYGRIAIFTSGQSLKYGDVVTMDADYGWTTSSKEWSTNPWTLMGWTWDDLNALEIGCSLKGWVYSGYYCADCTQIYIVIDYTANEVACCSSCIVM